MARMMAFKADDQEESEILAYCQSHHYKSIPDFLRFAVFAHMRKNRPGSHRKQSETAGEAPNGAQ